MGEGRAYISDLRAGMAVDEVFQVRQKDLRTTRAGDPYVSCTLCDRTGQVAARMWQASETIFQSIQTGGFLQVKGRVEDYKGESAQAVPSA